MNIFYTKSIITSCMIDDVSNQKILIQWQTNLQQKQSMNASTQEQTDYSEISQLEQDSTLLDIEVDQILFSINLGHNPTFQQEEFIHNLFSHNIIQKLKLGLSTELAEDDKTKKFEEWLYTLRNRNGAEFSKGIERIELIKIECNTILDRRCWLKNENQRKVYYMDTFHTDTMSIKVIADLNKDGELLQLFLSQIDYQEFMILLRDRFADQLKQ